jgi:hypothetical protein
MQSLLEIENRFEKQLETIEQLVDFDRQIQDICVSHIENLNSKLKRAPFQITNPIYLADNAIQAIKNIRQHDSLRKHYQSIFNSCLVLQISYFTSILQDIFEYTFQYLSTNGLLPHMVDSEKPENYLEELINNKKSISFQNMESVCKSYKRYLDIDISRDQKFNTIVLAVASRHAIVHASGRADRKFLQQISNANPRDIKNMLVENEEIQFSSTELSYVKFATLVFIQELRDKFKMKYSLE